MDIENLGFTDFCFTVLLSTETVVLTALDLYKELINVDY